jgi:hypothetical protein
MIFVDPLQVKIHMEALCSPLSTADPVGEGHVSHPYPRVTAHHWPFCGLCEAPSCLALSFGLLRAGLNET